MIDIGGLRCKNRATPVFENQTLEMPALRKMNPSESSKVSLMILDELRMPPSRRNVRLDAEFRCAYTIELSSKLKDWNLFAMNETD